MRVYPIVLSGGSGTRLWPLSRAHYPKQFIRLIDDLDGSLLQETVKRLATVDGFEPPIIVCNDAHRFLVRDELEEIGVKPHSVMLEPVGRNTAPAIAAAALSITDHDPDALIVVMPSDHVIGKLTKFREAVCNATELAKTGKLVLFGIPARSPQTEYGYIRQGEIISDFDNIAYTVAEFREKPDLKTAEHYVADGNYYWNSGLFVLPAAVFLAELESFAPDVLLAAQSAVQLAKEDIGFIRLNESAFEASPSISIDYAVMEKTKSAAMLPLDADWSDVGSWSVLWQLADRDARDNAVVGGTSCILEDTRNCYIHSDRAVVATIGVENLVIIDTPDALLIADKNRTQDVGRIASRLKAENRPQHASHVREHRPWGYFEPLNIGSRFQVKLLHVKPGGQLSYQMHHHRSEHWVVVKGTAKVTIGDLEKLVSENESVYIFATQWHRLENPGKVPLEIIEVQLGSYLGEDDIIRSEDIYNRSERE